MDEETFKQTNTEVLTEQLYENAIAQYQIKSEMIEDSNIACY